MMRRSHLKLLGLLGFLTLNIVVPVEAAGPLAPDQLTERQIDAAARAFDADYLPARDILRRLGFPPSGEEWSGVDKWPLDRQLEAAYLAAEEGRQSSGDELLRAVTRRMAVHVDAVRHDDELRVYFSEPSSAPLVGEPWPQLQFVKPSQVKLETGAPEKVRQVIAAIGRHTIHFPGGLTVLSQRCCQLERNDAYRRLLRAENVRDFLLDALVQSAVPPELAEKLARVLQDTVRFDATVLDDPLLQEYRIALETVLQRPNEQEHLKLAAMVRESLPTTAAPDDLVDGIAKEIGAVVARANSVGGEKPTLAELLQTATKETNERTATLATDSPFMAPGGGGKPTFSDMRYRTFEYANYGSPAASRIGGESGRSFIGVRGAIRGFGGVVLGNEVTADPSIPAPVAVGWQPLDSTIVTAGGGDSTAPSLSSGRGAFVFLFADGTRALSPFVDIEDAAAAARIVFEGIPGVVEAWRPGDAIGLAGFDGEVQRYVVRDGVLTKADDLRGLTFIVHPALARLGLGQSAMMVDALPFIESGLLSRLLEIGGARDRLTQADRWLNHPGWRTYKITDVRLRVIRRGSSLVTVERSLEDGEGVGWESQLLQHAFLGFHGFDKQTGEPQRENVDFYSLVPTLASVSEDYGRINAFASTMALLRWARLHDARWLDRISATGEAPLAWGTVFLTNADNSGAPPRILFGPERFELARQTALMVSASATDLLPTHSPSALTDLGSRVLQNRLQRIAVSAASALLAPELSIQQHLDSEGQQRFYQLLGMESVESSEQLEALLATAPGIETDLQARNALEAAAERLTKEDPLASDVSSIVSSIVDTDTDLKMQLTAIESEREALMVERSRTTMEVNELNGIRSGNSPSLEWRWQFAPEDVKAATRADHDALHYANIEGRGAYWTQFSLWLVLPRPSAERIDAEATARNRRLVDIDQRLEELDAQRNGGLIPGFDAWYKLQISYRTACADGVCM